MSGRAGRQAARRRRRRQKPNGACRTSTALPSNAGALTAVLGEPGTSPGSELSGPPTCSTYFSSARRSWTSCCAMPDRSTQLTGSAGHRGACPRKPRRRSASRRLGPCAAQWCVAETLQSNGSMWRRPGTECRSAAVTARQERAKSPAAAAHAAVMLLRTVPGLHTHASASTQLPAHCHVTPSDCKNALQEKQEAAARRRAAPRAAAPPQRALAYWLAEAFRARWPLVRAEARAWAARCRQRGGARRRSSEHVSHATRALAATPAPKHASCARSLPPPHPSTHLAHTSSSTTMQASCSIICCYQPCPQPSDEPSGRGAQTAPPCPRRCWYGARSSCTRCP